MPDETLTGLGAPRPGALPRPCESAPPAGFMRGTLRSLFGRRAGEIAGEPVLRPAVAGRPDEDPQPHHPVHPDRAAAHAAFRAVVGGGPRAVDAAIAVIEAEAREMRRRCLAQEEALKLLRLYAADDWARGIAARALERPVRRADLPDFLHDAALAAGTPCGCGGAR